MEGMMFMNNFMRSVAIVGMLIFYSYAQAAFFTMTYSKKNDIFFARFTWQEGIVLGYAGKEYEHPTGSISFNMTTLKGIISLTGVSSIGVDNIDAVGQMGIVIPLQSSLNSDEFAPFARALDEAIFNADVIDLSKALALEDANTHRTFYDELKNLIRTKFSGAQIRPLSWTYWTKRNWYFMKPYLRQIATGAAIAYVFVKAMEYLEHHYDTK
jgi:hypothetical protein